MHESANMKDAKTSRRGFSLIELALVLGISGLMLGFVLQSQQSAAVADCYAATKLQLRDIDGAIKRFARMNDRLPLPAARNVGVEGVTYGREASGGAIDAAGGASWGALPFQALGLAPSYASDCWGNKLTYVVTTALTTNAISGGYLDYNIVGNITVRKDASTNSSTTAAYAVISHGEDALGAVKNNYSNPAKNWCTGAATLATQNCLANAATVASANFNDGRDAGAAYFDDVIVASGRPQLLYTSNVYCWGRDVGGVGVLGDGILAAHDRWTPTQIQSNVKFAHFAEGRLGNEAPGSGRNYHCGVSVAGEVYCWGENTADRVIGDGTTTNRPVPVKTSGTSIIKKIIFGTFALDLSNQLYNWGSNNGRTDRPSPWTFGQVFSGSTISEIPDASISSRQCYLLTDGTAACRANAGSTGIADLGRGNTSFSSNLSPVLGGHKFAKIAGKLNGDGQSYCAITSAADAGGAGKLYCWGDNIYGELGLGDQLPRFQPTLVPGHSFANIWSLNVGFAALSDGNDVNPNRMYAWGHNASTGSNRLGTGGTLGVNYGTASPQPSTMQIISAPANATKVTFTTASPHGFVDGDRVSFSKQTTGGAWLSSWQISGNIFTVTDATSTTFTLFYNNGTARYRDTLSSLNQDATITNITNANPAVVTTAAPHGYVNGDQVAIRGVSGMPEINALASVYVANATATTFELQNSSGLNIDSTTWGTYTSGGIAGDFLHVSKMPTGSCLTTSGNLNGMVPFGICQWTPTLMNTTAQFASVSLSSPCSSANSVHALTSDGTLYGWGSNFSRSLGNGVAFNAAVNSPIALAMPPGVKVQKMLAASSGTYTAGQYLGRDMNYYTMCFDSGTTGNGAPTNLGMSATPAVQLNGMQFVDVSRMGQTACGIKFDPDHDCATQIVNWSAGGNNCSASARALVDGTSLEVANTTIGVQGKVTVSCTDKVMTVLPGGTCSTLAPACTADGASSGGNPASCCNGDSDGNGTCGTQGGACTPAEEALFHSICPPGSSGTVTDWTTVTVNACSSCGGGRFRAICHYNHSHSEYGAWDEERDSETNMYYDGFSATNGSYCQVETRSTGHPSGAGITYTGTCPFVQAACP